MVKVKAKRHRGLILSSAAPRTRDVLAQLALTYGPVRYLGQAMSRTSNLHQIKAIIKRPFMNCTEVQEPSVMGLNTELIQMAPCQHEIGLDRSRDSVVSDQIIKQVNCTLFPSHCWTSFPISDQLLVISDQ